MLINFTNHPSQHWEDTQRKASLAYGELVEMPFPHVDPHATKEDLQVIAQECVQRIVSSGSAQHLTVHVMGEMTFTFMVVTRLKELGIRCVASTTERKVAYTAEGVKQTEFSFVQFREY